MNTLKVIVRYVGIAFAAVVMVVTLAGCDGNLSNAFPHNSSSNTAGPSTEGGNVDVAGALQQLNTLQVKGRAPKTGYSRDQFGQAWADVDNNDCDTRNDILNRDLTNKTYSNSKNCVVLTGVLDDPYTGKTIDFKRGKETSGAVQIDHIVPLSDAWQKGAQQLTSDQRLHLANDPLNLLAADGPTNQAKSDGDAATWLPPNKNFRKEYVTRQITVKAKYGLWVTQAEKDAMTKVLSN